MTSRPGQTERVRLFAKDFVHQVRTAIQYLVMVFKGGQR
jgi:hypothetical protein